MSAPIDLNSNLPREISRVTEIDLVGTMHLRLTLNCELLLHLWKWSMMSWYPDAGEGLITYILQVLGLLGVKWLGHLDGLLVNSTL